MSIIVQYGTPAIMSGRTASVVAPKLSCGNAMVYAQVLGVSGITGIVHWFSIYEILAHELMIIVIAGWFFSIIGILCGGYVIFKERSIKNSGLLLIFIAQIFSAYYLGFLTVV